MRIGTILAFLVSLLVQVSVPLVATLWFRKRTRAPWTLFFYGVAVYIVFQLFTWLPLSVYLDSTLGTRFTSQSGAFIWLLALAFFTSLVEETGRWLGYRYLFAKGGQRLTWRNGVMYGLGHGAVETILLIAGLTFVYLIAYALLSSIDLTDVLTSLGAEGNLSMQNALQAIIDTTPSQPLIVAIERVLTLVHQVAWSLMVMGSLHLKRKRWFVFAVGYHTSVAVIVPGLARIAGFGVAEVVNVLLAVVSLWIIFRLRVPSLED